MADPVQISFIIPALNEAASLPATLGSIYAHVPPGMRYEVIVADNGSTDDTVSIARAGNAVVLVDKAATVGGLRNRAAAMAQGDVLVFLDADIELTADWGREFPAVYAGLRASPGQLTGSRCGIPECASLIERYWFAPLLLKQGNYVNSGHMITSRELFDRVGGFEEQLETGEDYAFGEAARRLDAVIMNNPRLAVIHSGYPKTLRRFMRREIWHGRGDCRSLRALTGSRVALLAVLLFLLQAASLLAFAGFGSILALVAGLLPVAVICILLAITRHQARSPLAVLVVAALYYCYFMARFISCVVVRFQGMRTGRLPEDAG